MPSVAAVDGLRHHIYRLLKAHDLITSPAYATRWRISPYRR
jgi:hypothetical protein